MNAELLDKIKRAQKEGASASQIRTNLVSQGFLEDDVLETIDSVFSIKRIGDDKRNESIFTWKELLDRLAYGFANNQFINVLLYTLGANYFIVGLVNGIKTSLSMFFSSFIQEFSKYRHIGKRIMSFSGILFGLSFMAIAFSMLFHSVLFFSIAFVLGALGVVTYGDLYAKFTNDNLKHERAGRFLLFLSRYGILLTGFAMLLSGYLFDKFPVFNPIQINFYGKLVPVFGYLVCFEITAIAFILSGYALSFIDEKKIESRPFFIREFWDRVKSNKKVLMKNHYTWLLLFASSITALAQIIGNAYYGIFIFETFKDSGFGPYLNISFIFTFAIFVSFVGPVFSTFINKKVGLAPTLVFGTLLIAIMPLACIYNPHFLNITIAYGLSVVGAAILGLGQGLLLRKLLKEEERQAFFSAINILSSVPFLILIALGAMIADSQGLVFLFKIISAVLLLISAPIYFLIVALANKARL